MVIMKSGMSKPLQPYANQDAYSSRDQLEVTAPEQVDAIRRWREAGTLEVPLDEMKTLSEH